jgi:CP12 domain
MNNKNTSRNREPSAMSITRLFPQTTPIATTAETTTQTTTSTPARPTRRRLIDSELRASREHARRLTALYGPCNPATAAAWDAVEEILTLKADQRVEQITAFQRYCQENPAAPEARIYDV